MISRRLFAVTFFVACATKPADRCATCGMKIDAKSPFRSQLVVRGSTKIFDTPRCGLSAYKKEGGSLHVLEFYSRADRDASELRFVFGSDVLGPMGPEIIPVDPERAAKFEKDHGASRIVSLDAIDERMLAN